jgi:signal peptidase I
VNEEPAAEERHDAPAGQPLPPAPEPDALPPIEPVPGGQAPAAWAAPRDADGGGEPAASSGEREWDTWQAPDFVPPASAGFSPEEDPAAAQAASRRRTRNLIRELVETGLLALLVFLAVRASFQNYRVHGHSMDPTLQDGEFLLVNRLEYAQINVDKLGRFIPFLDTSGDDKRNVFHGPERGDIVILEDPRNPSGDRLVKRVIGLPGEKLEIVNGVVYINGHKLDEPYIKQVPTGNTPPVVLPPNEYFVMGDNRNNSDDSRFLGLIPRDLIIGKAMVAFWPTNKFGLAPNEAPTLEPQVTR